MAHGTFELRVSEQKLNHSQIVRFSCKSGRPSSVASSGYHTRSYRAQRSRPTHGRSARTFTPRDAARETAREQVSTSAGVEGGQPPADRAPDLLGDLELHR